MKSTLLVAVVLILSACGSLHKPIESKDDYIHAIREHISKRFFLPQDFTNKNFSCRVRVTQDTNGNKTSHAFENCDVSPELLNAITFAVDSPDPLPVPDDSSLFEPEIVFLFGQAPEKSNGFNEDIN